MIIENLDSLDLYLMLLFEATDAIYLMYKKVKLLIIEPLFYACMTFRPSHVFSLMQRIIYYRPTQVVLSSRSESSCRYVMGNLRGHFIGIMFDMNTSLPSLLF